MRWTPQAAVPARLRYALYGALFGACFPVVSVVFLGLAGRAKGSGLWSMARAAHHDPLLYLIDTAPLFLGLFAYIAGVHQDRLQAFSRNLELQVAEKTDSLQQALRRAEQAHEMVLHLAEHDALTGLLNRRSFQNELERWVQHAERYRRPLSLLFLDADHFKSINDTYGHKAGDQYLEAIAGVFRELLRATDVVARLGGDEFAVLLPEADGEAALQVAGKLLQQLEHTAAIPGSAVSPSLSIGVASFPEDGNNAADLVLHSDSAMYTAKSMGGRCAQRYSPTAHAAAPAAVRWDSRIRQALERDQFLLFYQPLLNLATRATEGYEALLRMEDSNGTLLGPGLFLESAERFSLSATIDRMVIRKAAYKIALLGPAAPWISLNLSQQSLLDATLGDYITEVLGSKEVAPERLRFEITESAVLQHPAAVRLLAARLGALGSSLIIDDFNIGTASLRSLHEAPVRMAKLDGSLIRDLGRNSVNQALIRSLVHIAHAQELQVTAKCVEDPGTLERLVDLGVDYVQGFAVGQPMEAMELAHARLPDIHASRLPPDPLPTIPRG